MNRLVASLIFLVGFPLLFVAGVGGSEYALSTIQPERFPNGWNPLPRIQEGHIPPLYAAVAFAVIGCGIFDIVDIFGGLSDYRKGMRGYLPKQNPMGFVAMRARRYVLVFVVAAATFVMAYIAEYTSRFGPFANTNRPHLYLAGAALLTARRPLNAKPLLALLAGIAVLFKMAEESADSFAQGRPVQRRD